ncbi:hypothetical protein [Paenibacillus sp. SYP-B4298]|uniref:hypothetical protein n=1 Tax=Paenibacillus sp. SYP-B4298 TaxID=2996034 RepID=UPI0022DDC305|nr:hypothetical protein [Paenibacillus sp. SYP-B4298]
MDRRVRYIIEDLLPLYHENLLQPETKQWLEEQLGSSDEYQELAQHAAQPLQITPSELPPPAADYSAMIRRIQRRLSLYQLLFVALSFFLALQTSLLNNSFGFILWYTVLGLLTYLFYRSAVTVLAISAAPILLWSLGQSIAEWASGSGGDSLIIYVLQSFASGALLALLHGGFAMMGCCMGWLIRKLREGGEKDDI